MNWPRVTSTKTLQVYCIYVCVYYNVILWFYCGYDLSNVVKVGSLEMRINVFLCWIFLADSMRKIMKNILDIFIYLQLVQVYHVI